MIGLTPALGLLLALAAAQPQAQREIEIFGTGQTISAGMNSYFSDTDYPAEARRAGEQGSVRFRVDVSQNGRVQNCTIVVSSGHSLLDDATCRIARDRFHFVPGLDEYGIPLTQTMDYILVWRLPS